MQIVELSGMSYPAVRGTIDRFEAGGMVAIKPAGRGKRSGDGRTLTEEQERAIQRIICDKRPEQLNMEFALWNRAAVMQLIEREYGIKLSVRGVGNYLSRWGFTPQKPIKKAYEQRPEAVQAWLNEQYRLNLATFNLAINPLGVQLQHCPSDRHADLPTLFQEDPKI